MSFINFLICLFIIGKSFSDHIPVYCVNRTEFGTFTQLISENLDSCQSSCLDVEKHTFYGFNKVYSLCACLRKKPTQIAENLCNELCESGNFCGGLDSKTYSLYAYCAMNKFGSKCQKTCSCLDDWCTSSGACASEAGGNCRFGRDKWTYKGEVVCKVGSDLPNDDLTRAQDTVTDKLKNNTDVQDVITTLTELRDNFTDITDLTNDENIDTLRKVKSDVVDIVIEQLANTTNENSTELLTLLKDFTDDADQFLVKGNGTNPVDVIKDVITNPNSSFDFSEDNVKLVTDIISNVLKNKVVNTEDGEDDKQTRDLYDKANDLINTIGEKVMKNMQPNETLEIDNNMFTTKFVKTTNDTTITFGRDKGKGPTTVVGFKTNSTNGTNPYTVQITKFKDPKLGGKTSSDVFDVKILSKDEEVKDLGENELEFSSTPQVVENDTHITRFNLTTNNSIPNFLQMKVSSGSVLRLDLKLNYFTDQKEVGRTRGAFVVSACEITHSGFIYKLILKTPDNCYDVYVKKLNYFRDYRDSVTLDIPFMLISGLKTYSLIFDFVSIHEVSVMIQLKTFTFSCVFMETNSTDWESGCSLNEKILAEKLEVKCSCRHLTLFSTLASMSPNNVDVSRSLKKGLGTYIGIYVIISVYAVSVIICFIAQLLDNRASLMRKPIDLADNKPASLQIYMLIINTGHVIFSGATDEVFIMLIGTRGISSPHCLTCKKFKVLQTGDRNLFLVRVKKGLGDILKIRLWHHGEGIMANWFVKDVMVIDMETNRRYFFLCNYWLGPISGDESSDASFLENKMALHDFKYLFKHNMLNGIISIHPLISVFLCPRGEITFTRLERAATLGTRIMGYFMCSIMQYGTVHGREYEMDFFWGLSYSLADVTTAFYNTIILTPVTLTLEFLFSHSRRFIPNPMIICDWRVDTEEGIPAIEYEEIKDGEETENVEIDEIPESLPMCSIFLAWTLIITCSVVFSCLLVLYTIEYGERKTYGWYYNSFFPTILGFVLEDIFSFVGVSLTATFFMKERIEPTFYYMNAIKWNCILSLANISENDLEGIKNQRKSPKYKPPESIPRPVNFNIILIKIIINIISLTGIIIFAFIAISYVHNNYDVYLNNVSSLRTFLSETHMHTIKDKDDFWAWLESIFVARLYANTVATSTSTTSKFLLVSDATKTATNSSYFLKSPCVTRIPLKRIWWNVYMAREIAINGEHYCMGSYRNLAFASNMIMKRLSWLHNGMSGVGVETTLYVPSTDSIVTMFVAFEMAYGGGLKTLVKMNGVSLFHDLFPITLATGIVICSFSMLILFFHAYAALFHANTKPKKIPLMFLLLFLTIINLTFSCYCFHAEDSSTDLILWFTSENFSQALSFNSTMRLSAYLVLFCALYQLLVCFYAFLDETQVALYAYHIYCFIIDLIFLMMYFLPLYTIFVYIVFREFGRYTGSLSSLTKCMAFPTVLVIRGYRWADAISTSGSLGVFTLFPLIYFSLYLLMLIGTSVFMVKFKQRRYVKEHNQNRLPQEVTLLRFLGKDEAIVRAQKLMEMRQKRRQLNEEA